MFKIMKDGNGLTTDKSAIEYAISRLEKIQSIWTNSEKKIVAQGDYMYILAEKTIKELKEYQKSSLGKRKRKPKVNPRIWDDVIEIACSAFLQTNKNHPDSFEGTYGTFAENLSKNIGLLKCRYAEKSNIEPGSPSKDWNEIYQLMNKVYTLVEAQVKQ